MATFFEQWGRSERLQPTDPNVRPDDAPRLGKQCEKILAMLRDRPHWNHELVSVSLKYTSRISDLRKAGYNVVAAERRGGSTLYELRGSPQGEGNGPDAMPNDAG